MFIFLDESGNFTKDKEPYFLIAGFITNNPRRTAKAFRKWQHTKFPKKLRWKNEVKFTSSGINQLLRLKTINYLSKQDLRIFYIFLDKNNIPLKYRTKKGLETGLLYVQVVGRALEIILPIQENEFRVFLDKRPLKGISVEQFKETLRLKLLPDLPKEQQFYKLKLLTRQRNPMFKSLTGFVGLYFVFTTKNRMVKNILKS